MTTWKEFIRVHTEMLAAMDFLTTTVWTKTGLVTGMTPNPDAAWMALIAKLPARSSNLNGHAERSVGSIKSECLSRIILSGEATLSRTKNEFVTHYHEAC